MYPTLKHNWTDQAFSCPNFHLVRYKNGANFSICPMVMNISKFISSTPVLDSVR